MKLKAQMLDVTFADGTFESVRVLCGRARLARWLPARIGRALATGQASATLRFDDLPRTAIKQGDRYYMRIDPSASYWTVGAVWPGGCGHQHRTLLGIKRCLRVKNPDRRIVYRTDGATFRLVDGLLQLLQEAS